MLFDPTMIHTESDVEQKFIFPFLVDAQGLAFSKDEILTKTRIRKLSIDKGQALKSNYFPDYIISIDTIPLIIVEAKAPSVPLEEACREARLYANELNAQFPTGINPVTLYIATNGVDLYIAPIDSAAPTRYVVSELSLQSESLVQLRKLASRETLIQRALQLKTKLWPSRKFKPSRFLQPARQNEEIEPNQFARQLVPLIKKFLDPDASRTRIDILQKAYVSTEQVTHYNEILEALLTDNISHKKFKSFEEIETTRNNAKSFNKALRDAIARGPQTDSLLLLIGSVGAGKSIFIDRFFYFLMDSDLRQNTLWAYVDFNNASSDLSNIRQWIAATILSDLETRNSITGFHDNEELMRYFSPEISKFRSGSNAKLYELDRVEYERRLATKLDEWTTNPEFYLKNVLRHYIGDCNKRVVIVFDNADKRDRDQQLQVFQDVQYFRTQHRVFSILALRDETYDRHRNEPPLDTYLAAFAFRITPPRFLDVVKRRLELLIEDLASGLEKTLEFHVGSGAVVRYPSSDLGNFLISFYQSLFHPKREIRLVLEALAGRNVRMALQMFSDILMSGHVSGSAVFMSRATGGAVHLPEKLVLRTLMRTKFRYFSDAHGYVTNVFGQNESFLQGSPFGIVLILGHLAENRKIRGELGIEGYRLVSGLLADLLPQSLSSDEGLALLKYLLERNLIQADHQRNDVLELDDHVKITASGYYHLKFLPTRFEYASATAMDTWFRTEERSLKVYHLTLHNFGHSSRSGNDKMRRVRLLLDELTAEREAWRATSVLPFSHHIDEAIDAASSALQRFADPQTRQQPMQFAHLRNSDSEMHFPKGELPAK